MTIWQYDERYYLMSVGADSGVKNPRHLRRITQWATDRVWRHGRLRGIYGSHQTPACKAVQIHVRYTYSLFHKKMEALVNSFYLVKHKFKLCKPHTKHARIIVLCESKIHVFLFLNCCLSVLLDISNQNFKLRIWRICPCTVHLQSQPDVKQQHSVMIA